jgi:DNA invertase Pin-like site-specific DNA recombinase
MRKIAYLRVSTAEQRPDRQIDGLRELCDELHIEKVSAVAKRRPVYERVIRNLEPGDKLVVWDLDRAFRSSLDALSEIEKLRARGIELQIANLHIDTSTPAGIFVYTIMSALAEFERRMLSQRTKEGMAAARKRGKRLGRPPKMSTPQLAAARLRIEVNNETVKSVAKRYGVAPWTLSRALTRVSNRSTNGRDNA